MGIQHFNDLLTAARQQPDVQRLLLVFAAASLPANATAQQRAAFESGESGELSPLMCVDKDPADWQDFVAMEAEACRRRSNIDPPCRSNTDPGMDVGRVTANCG